MARAPCLSGQRTGLESVLYEFKTLNTGGYVSFFRISKSEADTAKKKSKNTSSNLKENRKD